MIPFIAASVNPTTLSSSANGQAVDFNGQEEACFAIQHVGDLDDAGTLDGAIEESSTGVGAWTAIAGATFVQVDTANDLQVIYFTRTKRYLRWAGVIAGTPVFTVAAELGTFVPIDNSILPQPANARTMLSAQPKNISCYASAARTTTPDPMATQNSQGARGIEVVLDITVVPGAAPSLVVTIQGLDRVSGKFFTLLQSAAKVAVGTTILRVYPGLTAAANLVASDALPPFWRVIVEAGNANEATYSVGASLLY